MHKSIKFTFEEDEMFSYRKKRKKKKPKLGVLDVLTTLQYDYNRNTMQTIQPNQNRHVNVRTNQ